MLVVLWRIWKARNVLIFDSKNSTATGGLRSIHKDLCTCACRFRRNKELVNSWAAYIQSIASDV
jgi:hypothetical protein